MTFQDPDRIPARLRPRVAEIDALTSSFADAHLNDEYAVLCRRMASTLAQQRPSLLARDAAVTWAAAIVHAVGWVNFLSDPAEKPHMTMTQLAAATNVTASAIAAHSRKIRKRLYLSQFDPDWTLPSLMPDNPLAWLIEVDGVPVDMRFAPLELQEEALRRGFIPYIPSVGDTLPKLDPRDYLSDDGLEPDAFRTVEDPPDHPSDDGLEPDAFWAEEDPPGGAGDPSDEGDLIPDEFRAMIEQLLAGAAGALPPSATMVDLNSALAGIVQEYNTRPQAELGGLSPDNLQELLDADWLSPESAIQIDDSLKLNDLASSRTLDDARLVLDLLAEQGRVKATPRKNLPRTFVAAFRERMRPRGSAMEERDHGLERGPRTLNEEDLWSLHMTRRLLELAGLVKLRKGVFSRTRRGERLTHAEAAGELFVLLLSTLFLRMNLAYLDRAAPAPDFQHTIGFTLYQFDRVGDDWKSAGELVDTLVLPMVRDELPTSNYFDEPAFILEMRFLRQLEGFGMAEARELAREPGSALPRTEWRKTELFGRVVTFEIDATDSPRTDA